MNGSVSIEKVVFHYKLVVIPELTEDEKIIMALLIEGCNYEEIAEQMQLSLSGLRSKIARLRKKTNSNSNEQLIAKYLLCFHNL